MTTDTETQPPIHAAIPDGEVDEIRKRHGMRSELIAEHRFDDADAYYLLMKVKRMHADEATLLARLTALEAENVSEREARHKLEAALRSKDAAMQTLFDRLRSHGDNCEDLIP